MRDWSPQDWALLVSSVVLPLGLAALIYLWPIPSLLVGGIVSMVAGMLFWFWVDWPELARPVAYGMAGGFFGGGATLVVTAGIARAVLIALARMRGS